MNEYILMWRVGHEMHKEIVEARDADDAILSWEAFVEDDPDTQLLLCDLVD
jgi:hypothetical protein